MANKVAPEVSEWFEQHPTGKAYLEIWPILTEPLPDVKVYTILGDAYLEESNKVAQYSVYLQAKEKAITEGTLLYVSYVDGWLVRLEEGVSVKGKVAELEQEKQKLREWQDRLAKQRQEARKEVFRRQIAVIKPVKSEVVAQVRQIPEVTLLCEHFYDEPDNDWVYTLAEFGVITNVVGLEKILEIPQVARVSLDQVAEARLNVSVPAIDADHVHNQGIKGSGVQVAILDTGIYDQHNYIADIPPANEADFTGEGVQDDNGHGTQVAGVVASTHTTCLGVAPECILLNAKCVGQDGIARLIPLRSGTQWAGQQKGVDILNYSVTSATLDDGNNNWSNYIDWAVENYDMVWANASGINGLKPLAPAGAYNIISVGAFNDNDSEWRGDDSWYGDSSQGPTPDGRYKPDIVAPGVMICTTNKADPNSFTNAIGTSVAAPHVAGVTALLRNADSQITPLAMKAVILNSAYKTVGGIWDSKWGFGEVDALTAYNTRGNRWSEHVLPGPNNIKERYIVYPSGTVRVTLCWLRHMDKSDGTYFEKTLSNLNLRIEQLGVGPIGDTTWQPARNNVKQIQFDGNPAEKYRVVVSGTTIDTQKLPNGESFMVASTHQLSQNP